MFSSLKKTTITESNQISSAVNYGENLVKNNSITPPDKAKIAYVSGPIKSINNLLK